MNQADRNVDLDEINKFSERAYSWWDTEGEFKTLHEINPLRLAYILQWSKGLQGKRVLDVGCGGGILSESLKVAGAEQVVAIDAGLEVIEVAKAHLMESEVEVDYRHLTVEQLAEAEPGSFDVITCMEMLEHVPDPASIIAACSTLIKPGGWLFFSTLNRHPKSFLHAIVGAEYLLNMLPRGTHDYAKFIKPNELAHWLRDSSLTVKDMAGMQYRPLTKSYWVGGDVKVNYLVASVKN